MHEPAKNGANIALRMNELVNACLKILSDPKASGEAKRSAAVARTNLETANFWLNQAAFTYEHDLNTTEEEV